MGSANLRVAPIDVWFLGCLRVHIPPKPLGERRFVYQSVSQCPQHFADGPPDERVAVYRSGRAQYIAAVQQLAGIFGEQPCSPSGAYQSLEQLPLQPSLQKLAPEVAQHGSVEALIFEIETEGVFPSQVEAHPLLGLRVRAIVMVLEEHGEDHHRGRDGGPASRRILVERGVVLVVDEYVAPFGEASVERIGGDHLRPGLRVCGRQVAAAAHHAGSSFFGVPRCYIRRPQTAIKSAATYTCSPPR